MKHPTCNIENKNSPIKHELVMYLGQDKNAQSVIIISIPTLVKIIPIRFKKII